MGTIGRVAFYSNIGLAVLLTGSLSIAGSSKTKKFQNEPSPTNTRSIAITTQKNEKSKGGSKKDPPGPPTINNKGAANNKAAAAGGKYKHGSKREFLIETAYYEFQEMEVRTGLRLSEGEKELLVDKFISDADGNPYFWTALKEYIAEAKLKLSTTRSTKDISEKSAGQKSPNQVKGHDSQSSEETGKNKQPSAKKPNITTSQTAAKPSDGEETVAPAPDLSSQISFVGFLSQKWGDVILSSEPDGAEVWLVGKSTSNEGETRVKRRYPEGTYNFTLTKSGYKPASITVEVKKDKKAEEKVVLESQ